MEQSMPRHFIFTNNLAFLFRQCNNPSTGHSRWTCVGTFAGGILTGIEKRRWLMKVIEWENIAVARMKIRLFWSR